MTQSVASDRRLIFISHATPQDNDIAIWLSARLAAAGYEVWSDVTKLIGGETHWDNIEAAIRLHSAKVVSILSKAAIVKRGFMAELSLGLAVEAKASLKDFVIPMRLDDLDYADFPTEIIRRNAIDLSGRWHEGLSKLLRKLEVDCVPRRRLMETNSVSEWASSFLNTDGALVVRQEPVISNSLPVVTPPKSIVISQRKVGSTDVPTCEYPGPTEMRGDSAISFFRLDRVDPMRFGHVSEMDFQHFLNDGGANRLNAKRSDIRNAVTKMMRYALDEKIRRFGLSQYRFSTGRLGHFLPYSESSSRYKFIGPTGVPGARALFGRSEVKKVYWHYAPELYPVVTNSIDFYFKPHVIFSEDGITPIEDSSRSHRLRRSFCKSWWQDKWRDLMLAYLANLAEGGTTIRVPLSETASFELAACPDVYLCPVSADVPDRITSEVIEEIDTSDDDFDDEHFDEHIEGDAQ